MMNIQKAAVIGCGFVGASTAFSLVQKGLFSELVLIDANKEKAEGEAMDLSHGRPFVHSMKIYAGDYDDISDCALIIITAGANQKPGETRLDLVHKNVAIFKSIIPEITKRNFEGNLLIVANPVDILTYAALKISGYPKERVFGSGTVLDSARFRYLLSEHLDVDSRSVHAFIIGEHGDSELAVWSSANVAGIDIHDFCELRGHYEHDAAMERIYKEVRDSAYAWDTTRILHTYVLVDKEKSLPADLPEGTLVRTPLSKAVVYSSVHCGLLNQIGALKSIGGVCDLKYIKLQEVQDGCRTGSIADVGNGMNPDIEKIIDLHPDAIMLSPFENSGGYGRVEKLNIPIIECADYMETSALGRAEWMRFYGLLFGEAQKADSLFAEVEKNYNELKALVAPLSSAPSVISELKNGSAWYVPGGKSTSARIYADAGANYVFADDEHSGSVPLAFETVFDKGQNADFWLIKYNQAIDKTYKELEQDYAPYTGFRAFKERNIYGCNTGKVDFYEDSPFHPDRLLKDLIKIFHPTLLEGYELKYFTKLAE